MSADEDPTVPRGLRRTTDVTHAVRQLLRPPADLPILDSAIEGLVLTLHALVVRLPSAKPLLLAVQTHRTALNHEVPPGQSRVALHGRLGRHPAYYALIVLAHAAGKDRPLNNVLLALIAALLLRSLVSSYEVKATALAKVRQALVNPNSKHASSWKESDQLRALRRALVGLQEDILANASVAADLGLKAAPAKPSTPTVGIALFNQKLLARRSARARHANEFERAASGGHGALSEGDAYRTGESLLAGLLADVPTAIASCLHVYGDLSSQVLGLLPVALGDEPPNGALAWLDLQGGSVCYLLVHVTRKGRRPAKGSEDLYEETEQVIRIYLMRPLVEALRRAARDLSNTVWVHLRDLPGVVVPKPLDALAGAGSYRATARKLHTAIAAHLVAKDHQRWPVSLATQKGEVVAAAREFYGACRTRLVDDANLTRHALLGWPAPTAPSGNRLVGSYVTPTSETICRIFQMFASAADRAADLSTRIAVEKRINRHAEYLGVVMELCFDLRGWAVYQLSPRRLSEGKEAVFSEKDVHDDLEAPVPAIELARSSMIGWRGLLRESAGMLRAFGDNESVDLAHKIEVELDRDDGLDRAFTIGADLELHRIGHHTWMSRLPVGLRVEANFGRHFWPLPLTDEGVPQLVQDVLMRQQLQGLHAGSQHREGTRHADALRLAEVMERVLARLVLAFPRGFCGGSP